MPNPLITSGRYEASIELMGLDETTRTSSGRIAIGTNGRRLASPGEAKVRSIPAKRKV
jgi:hypothetical protein